MASGYSPISDDGGDFKVFMPDFLGGNPADLSNYPPKTQHQSKAIGDFMTGCFEDRDSSRRTSQHGRSSGGTL